MKIYLDDERTPPSGWKLLKTPKEVIKFLKTGKVKELSLDHDLGDDTHIGTSYDVLLWIEEQVYLHNFKPPKIKVHSANISARNKMEAAIKSINKKINNENIMKKSELKKIIKEELNKMLSEKLVINKFFIETSVDKLEHVKKVFKDDDKLNSLITQAISLIKNYKK